MNGRAEIGLQARDVLFNIKLSTCISRFDFIINSSHIHANLFTFSIWDTYTNEEIDEIDE